MNPDMKQSKKQPVLTRHSILEAAGAEFSRHGYAGSGLGAIVRRAGLTKGALFHHFPDKQVMAVAWVEGPLAAAMDSCWQQALEAVASLDGMRSVCRARCMEMEAGNAESTLVSLMAEAGAGQGGLVAALSLVFDAWRGAVSNLLERGKEAGWIHPSIQPADEAAFLVSVFCGFTVTMKSSDDEKMKRTCATAMEAYLETLRPQ